MFLKPGHRPDHGFDEPLGLLSDCHRRIEHFLQVLIAVHARTAGCELTPGERGELEGALRYFEVAAPRHTADEDESLFPKLRESKDPAAQDVLDTLARLERDHGTADGHHRAVDRLVRRWLAEGILDAGGTRALDGHLAALKAIYDAHIGIEDREVFPSAGRLLTADQLGEVGREMAARRAIVLGKPGDDSRPH